MKHALVTVLLLTSLAFAQHAVHNWDFGASLDTWYTFGEHNQWYPTMGTAEWSPLYGGSAMLAVDGGPGVVGMFQPIARALNSGDSVTLNLQVMNDMTGFSSFGLYVGGEPAYIPTACETIGSWTPGSHHLSLTLPRNYAIGEPLMFKLVAFPGVCTVYVGSVLGIAESPAPRSPVTQTLLRASPNPVSQGADISYELPRKGHAVLRIIDGGGRTVATLLDRNLDAGRYRATWDGRNLGGVPVPSGAYFYALEIDSRLISRALVVAR